MLINKQNKDEARVIARVADGMMEASVSSEIYETWQWGRQKIEDCHIAMSNSISP